LLKSTDALRIARHAKRQQGAFSVFSDDPVIQWCVEEALMEKLDREERRQREQAENQAAIAAAQAQVLAEVNAA
jgi:hypothetical protein